jgi:1-acyl-sn-glycerol-3-phosphate acyltransferase
MAIASSRAPTDHIRKPVDQNRLVRALARLTATREQRARVARMSLPDDGHGVDAFGLNRDWVALALGLTRGLYDVWFRVESRGHEHIPRSGAAILVANHSGTLPFDALMLWVDVARLTDPPRMVRPIADLFVPRLPLLSTLFARAGAIGGSRGNLEHLLDRGELVAIFPEGTPGIGKPFRERYTLKPFRPGHAELALRHGVPLVPVGIVGAEEQMPQLARLEARLFGAPYLPIPLTPFPLPVRYHLRYGSPVALGDLDAARASEPEVLEEATGRVEEAVRALVEAGLAERKGIFR